MNQKATSHLARYIDTGLKAGLFNQKDLIKWADDFIVKSTDPDRIYIELSLSEGKNIQYTIDALNEFLEANEPQPEAKYFFSVLQEKYFAGQFSCDDAMLILYRLIFTTKMSELEERSIRKIDSISWAFEEFYGKDNPQDAVEAFLKLYSDIEVPYPIF